jgi:hypothetical protein
MVTPLVVGATVRQFIYLVPFFLFTACAGLGDRITGAQTATDKLRAELGADIDLRLALQKDFARKNAQLMYISYGKYPCGPEKAFFKDVNPDTAGVLKTGARDARVEARGKFLTAKFADFKIVMDYADALGQAVNDRAAYTKTVNGIKTLLDTYKGLVPAEFAPVVALMKAATGIGGLVGDQIAQAKIIDIAVAAEEPLRKARQRMVDSGVLKSFTETESKAFHAWDECALDRLYFLREFNPASPPSYLSDSRGTLRSKTAGETQSPVILFSAEYKTYLDERAAFIAQRPDYLAAVDAILKANSKIAHPAEGASPDDVINTLNEMGKTANDAKAQWDDIVTQARALHLTN